MGRTTEHSLTCDHKDCRKSPSAEGNDHVEVHVVLNPAGEEAGQPAVRFDACSVEHAHSHLKAVLTELSRQSAARAREAEQQRKAFERAEREAEKQAARVKAENERMAREQAERERAEAEAQKAQPEASAPESS